MLGSDRVAASKCAGVLHKMATLTGRTHRSERARGGPRRCTTTVCVCVHAPSASDPCPSAP
eukprot:11210164-Lingulodinium_polyedra.AAC.1